MRSSAHRRDTSRSPSGRIVGDLPSELEVTFDQPETTRAFAALVRRHGYQARAGSRPTDVIVFIPPLTAEERRRFGVDSERGLVARLRKQAVEETNAHAREYVARRPGDPRAYRFRALSLEAARAHARKHLGAGATVEQSSSRSRDPGSRPPPSGVRLRQRRPAMHAGAALVRSVRAEGPHWERATIEDVDGMNRDARFAGFREIKGAYHAVWRVGSLYFAQPAVGRLHPSNFHS